MFARWLPGCSFKREKATLTMHDSSRSPIALKILKVLQTILASDNHLTGCEEASYWRAPATNECLCLTKLEMTTIHGPVFIAYTNEPSQRYDRIVARCYAGCCCFPAGGEVQKFSDLVPSNSQFSRSCGNTCIVTWDQSNSCWPGCTLWFLWRYQIPFDDKWPVSEDVARWDGSTIHIRDLQIDLKKDDCP